MSDEVKFVVDENEIVPPNDSRNNEIAVLPVPKYVVERHRIYLRKRIEETAYELREVRRSADRLLFALSVYQKELKGMDGETSVA
jgi:hypothetical protein